VTSVLVLAAAAAAGLNTGDNGLHNKMTSVMTWTHRSDVRLVSGNKLDLRGRAQESRQFLRAAL